MFYTNFWGKNIAITERCQTLEIAWKDQMFKKPLLNASQRKKQALKIASQKKKKRFKASVEKKNGFKNAKHHVL